MNTHDQRWCHCLFSDKPDLLQSGMIKTTTKKSIPLYCQTHVDIFLNHITFI